MTDHSFLIVQHDADFVCYAERRERLLEKGVSRFKAATCTQAVRSEELHASPTIQHIDQIGRAELRRGHPEPHVAVARRGVRLIASYQLRVRQQVHCRFSLATIISSITCGI